MTSSDILLAIRRKHSDPGELVIPELRDGTGLSQLRSIDAWVIHTFPSKGYLTTAYEIKVSRGDFLRELQNPKKRASAEAFSHQCYFACPVGLIQPVELPEGWGLLTISETGATKRVVVARQRSEWKPGISFVAALARRCGEADNELARLRLKYGGEEITEADLDRLVKEKLTRESDQLIAKLRRELREEVRAEYSTSAEAEAIKKLRALATYEGCRSLEDLPSYIERMQHRGFTPKWVADRARMLRELADSIEKAGIQ